ncbi:MAG TPA: TIM barrel protein [Verrucomicrobiota bacterium]|nr:TIM barrel protein [Verrucomicrobiota bacterium]HQL78953.1 TIM barrel protein [Verrucomicrobiota bacterium]
MKISRRQFIRASSLSLGAVSLAPELPCGTAAATPASFVVRSPKMHLGLVTYNLAQDWDIPTIIKNCEAAQFEGVELRTSHAHKVEVNLTAEQRKEVRKRFQDSKVQLVGLGSTFDYHTPDQAKLRKDIEATREYIVLAQDVGASGIKVRPNALPKEVPVEKTLAQIGRALGELGNFARDHGQVIRLEVHGSGTSFPPHIKTILDTANHPSVGACWNSNPADLDGEGWDHNFDLLKDKIFCVHMRDLFVEDYPFRKLLTRLNEINFRGFCLAEAPASTDPVRVMKYYRGLWLAYQGLL